MEEINLGIFKCMDKRIYFFGTVLLHILFCVAFVGCSSDSVVSRLDTKNDESLLSSSAKTPEETAAISAIAHSCVPDSLVADSLLDVYEKEGNFGEATTKLADCAYQMTLERLNGDVIVRSAFERLERDFDLNYLDYKEAFYKFWQDDYGIGPCSRDSFNVVAKNKDSLSTVANYFICTDRREGFTSEINWVRASDLQVNAYKQDCDSTDYRGINNATTGKLYVCDHGKWRYPLEVEEKCGLCGSENNGLVKAGAIFEYVCNSNQWKLNEFILKDSRDNKEYRTTKVAGLYWMMDNMQADTARFYWDEASKEDFCPNGWRLPTADEWLEMFNAMDHKASNASIMSLQGAALRYSSWWTSTEVGADSVKTVSVLYRPMSYEESLKFGNYSTSTNTKMYPHSVRCVKNEL